MIVITISGKDNIWSVHQVKGQSRQSDTHACTNRHECSIEMIVITISGDQQLYDTEFQTEGALTLNSFANKLLIINQLCTIHSTQLSQSVNIANLP